MQQENEVWVCSDPHYHHKNLVKGVSNWNDKSGCRDFKSIPEHNQAIVEGINNNVKENDTLYCLGDWSFGGIDKIWEFRKQVNCRDIRFIYGNHDHHIENNKFLIIPQEDHRFDVEFLVEMYKEQNIRKHTFYLPKESTAWTGMLLPDEKKVVIPAQNLFTWCKYYKEIKHWGHKYVLSHYAFDVWNKRHHGRMHLFGHSHGTLPDRGDRRMDVGFEEAYRILGEYRPFNIKECQSILQSRKNKPLDHHNENTW